MHQQHQLEPVPVLDTPQVVVQEVRTVKQLMVAAFVVQTATYMVTAAQMFSVLQVIIIINN